MTASPAEPDEEATMGQEFSDMEPAVLIQKIKQDLTSHANNGHTTEHAQKWLASIRTELERLEAQSQNGALSEPARRTLLKELDLLWRRLLVGPLPPDNGFVMTPEFLEWARQQFSEEEIVAALREMREHGGYELHEFIHELEQAAGADE